MFWIEFFLIGCSPATLPLYSHDLCVHIPQEAVTLWDSSCDPFSQTRSSPLFTLGPSQRWRPKPPFLHRLPPIVPAESMWGGRIWISQKQFATRATTAANGQSMASWSSASPVEPDYSSHYVFSWFIFVITTERWECGLSCPHLGILIQNNWWFNAVLVMCWW